MISHKCLKSSAKILVCWQAVSFSGPVPLFYSNQNRAVRTRTFFLYGCANPRLRATFFARWGLNRPPIDHKIEFKAKVTVQAHLYFSSALSAGWAKIGQKFKYTLGSTHFLANLRLQSESQARKEMIRTLSVCLFVCTVLLSICMN